MRIQPDQVEREVHAEGVDGAGPQQEQPARRARAQPRQAEQAGACRGGDADLDPVYAERQRG